MNDKWDFTTLTLGGQVRHVLNIICAILVFGALVGVPWNKPDLESPADVVCVIFFTIGAVGWIVSSIVILSEDV